MTKDPENPTIFGGIPKLRRNDLGELPVWLKVGAALLMSGGGTFTTVETVVLGPMRAHIASLEATNARDLEEHKRILGLAIEGAKDRLDSCHSEKQWFRDALKAAAAKGPIGP